MSENCLVLIKPDALQKGLTGDIISMLSQANLKIIGVKATKVSDKLAESHYEHLKEKPFFRELIDFLTGKTHADRVIAIVYKGDDAIKKIRTLAGATNPEESNSNTIRSKYGRIHSETKQMENAVHASDSNESAEKEIKLWFKKDEITEEIYSDW